MSFKIFEKNLNFLYTKNLNSDFDAEKMNKTHKNTYMHQFFKLKIILF